MGWRGVVERIDAPLVWTTRRRFFKFGELVILDAPGNGGQRAGWHAVDGEDPFVARVKCVVIYL